MTEQWQSYCDEGNHFVSEEDIEWALKRGRFHIEASEGIYIDNLRCRYCGQEFTGNNMLGCNFDGCGGSVEIGENTEIDEND